jgi:predicted phosphohydrolase
MNTKKIAWLTDIHLNFLDLEARKLFYQRISDANTDSLLITGDIGEARDICKLLTELSTNIDKPIYFVLGNHDYYFGSVISVREAILALCAQNSKLYWLGKPEIIELNNHTILVGHDGWADGRYGDFDHSPVNLNDSRYISEQYQARLLNKSELLKEMQYLADADSVILKQTLVNAIKPTHKKVIIATHVPPFPECCWHQGMPTDDDWLPYFSSKATGDVILDVTKNYPDLDFLVLCGHTHTDKTIQLLKNLEIKVGKAQYYQPEIQDIIEVS